MFGYDEYSITLSMKSERFLVHLHKWQSFNDTKVDLFETTSIKQGQGVVECKLSSQWLESRLEFELGFI